MEIIKQSKELLDTTLSPLQKIERIGKVCTKMEHTIKDDSALTFFRNRIKEGHTAIANHAFVYFDMLAFRWLEFTKFVFDITPLSIGWIRHIKDDDDTYIVAVNYRVFIDILNHIAAYNHLNANIEIPPMVSYILHKSGIIEHLGDLIPTNLLESINEMLVDCEATCRLLDDDFVRNYYTSIYHISIKFTTDRGVSHELVRHCSMAFMQESTRYVNYGKRGIAFIKPAWMTDEEFDWLNSNGHDTIQTYDLTPDYVSLQAIHFYNSCLSDAREYLFLINEGVSPQEARTGLPNATKTDIFITAPINYWLGYEFIVDIGCISNEDKGFIPQRSSSKAHPDMQILCEGLRELIINEFDNYEY